MWPAVIGIYFFPANGGQIATVNIDRTGTTRIGKLVLNHSFFLPMIVCAVTAVSVGMLVARLLYGSN
jgi:anaerobic C4-dicarboxylate transporter